MFSFTIESFSELMLTSAMKVVCNILFYIFFSITEMNTFLTTQILQLDNTKMHHGQKKPISFF